MFQALADPTRRAMIRQLAAGERNISELAAPYDMSFVAAAKHVRVLEAAGLVSRRKAGRAQICSLRPELLATAAGWLKFYERLWTEQFDALDASLTRDDAVPAQGTGENPREVGTDERHGG